MTPKIVYIRVDPSSSILFIINWVELKKKCTYPPRDDGRSCPILPRKMFPEYS